MKTSLLVAVILFITYGVFLEFGPRPTEAKTQSQWQDNQLAIEKYFQLPKTPEAVFVGSSLTKRLIFNETDSCIYNLALGGESALTGLSVIAKSERMPGQVFIEINVPQRGINKDLIEKASGVLSGYSTLFNIGNMPVNIIYSFLRQGKKGESDLPLNEAVLQNALALKRQEYKQILPSSTLDNSLSEFSHLAGVIESKGAKITFFEMPVHPDLENTPRALQIRAKFKQTFPNNQFVGFDELSNGLPIRTMDGEHLTSDEAKNAALVLRNYYKNNCIAMQHQPMAEIKSPPISN
jgi:hypothetical protein